MVDRREFLRTITLASGAVFLGVPFGCGRTNDIRQIGQGSQQFRRAHSFVRDRQVLPSASRSSSAKVCIVGGGFAGITAAWLLAQQGIDCVLLEAEPVVGGCARTYQPKNVHQSVPLGNVYFVERSETLDAMAQSVGVSIKECPDDMYFVGDSMVRDIWTDADVAAVAVNPKDANGLRRFRDELLSMTDTQLPLYPVREASAEMIARYDSVSAFEFIQQYASPTLAMVLDAYSRSSMGAGLTDVNAFCLLNFYSDEFGASFDKGRWIMQGGTSELLKGIASSLPDVRSDRLAYRIEKNSSGWSVLAVGSDGVVERVHAEHVILSSPLFSTRALLRGSDVAQAALIPSLQYAPYMTIHMHSHQALTPPGSYDTWHLPAGEHYTDLVSTADASMPHTNEGRWTSAYAPLPVSRRSELMNEESIVRITNAAIDAVLQRLDLPADVVDDVYAWSWGHGVVVPSVGSHRAVREMVQSMPDGIHLACTDVDAAPSIENAIMAAEHVVARVLGT